MSKILNAQITRASLGYREDSAIFSFDINLIGSDGKNYRFGGYSLDTYDRDLNRRVATSDGLELVIHTLKVIGVSRWEELTGKYVRIIVTDKNLQYVNISTIGNLMQDKWLDAEKFWAERMNKKR